MDEAANKSRQAREVKRLGKRKAKAALNASRPYHPKSHRRHIKLDRVNPQDLARYTVRFFCDDCSHYDRSNARCTMGYVAQHTHAKQMALYNLTGQMAFCRFLEID